jgi:hypothetical protein
MNTSFTLPLLSTQKTTPLSTNKVETTTVTQGIEQILQWVKFFSVVFLVINFYLIAILANISVLQSDLNKSILSMRKTCEHHESIFDDPAYYS